MMSRCACALLLLLAVVQTTAQVQAMPNRCQESIRHDADSGQPTKLTIFGERHSGTNFLQVLLQRNFDVEITFEYGWKHWWLGNRPAEEQPRHGNIKLDTLRTYNDTAVVVIFREPVAWLMAMYREPHHTPFDPRLSFGDFLKRTPMKSFKVPNPHGWPPSSPVIETAQDIFTLRAEKIQAMLGVRRWHKRFHALQYEHLTGDQRGQMERIAHDLCLRWKSDALPDEPHKFQMLDTLIGPALSTRSPKHKKKTSHDTEMLSTLKTTTKKYLCSHLDCVAERLAGYNSSDALDCCR